MFVQVWLNQRQYSDILRHFTLFATAIARSRKISVIPCSNSYTDACHLNLLEMVCVLLLRTLLQEYLHEWGSVRWNYTLFLSLSLPQLAFGSINNDRHTYIQWLSDSSWIYAHILTLSIDRLNHLVHALACTTSHDHVDMVTMVTMYGSCNTAYRHIHTYSFVFDWAGSRTPHIKVSAPLFWL